MASIGARDLRVHVDAGSEADNQVSEAAMKKASARRTFAVRGIDVEALCHVLGGEGENPPPPEPPTSNVGGIIIGVG